MRQKQRGAATRASGVDQGLEIKMKTTKTVKYCVVTIRRPTGEIETVRHPKVTEMTPTLWRRFCDAMKAAGKGEGVEYKNCREELPLTLEEQRKELVWALSAALDRYQAAMDRACYSSVGGKHLVEASDAVKAAEAELAAFDAAHPEVAENIKSKRDARADQHMWD